MRITIIPLCQYL
nr:unnamed protein product [Callosobruchus chinensis]